MTNPTNQHVYKAIECGSWTQCDVAAQHQRAHLVTIENADENAWLVEQFGGDTHYWIGLTDRAAEGNFVWVTGEPLNFTNWNSGQPDNAGGVENYGHLIAEWNGSWNDWPEYVEVGTHAIIEQEPQTVIYSNDFSSGAGVEWSDATTAIANGEAFLGASEYGFGAGANTLTLTDLPSHTAVTVTFDLYIIQTWDGNGPAGGGPDNWELTADGANLLYTNFANYTGGGNTQAYPNPLPPYGPSGSLAPRTSAFDNGHLGFGTDDGGDATYRLTYTFPHTNSTLALTFNSLQNQSPGDEGWGLDNVEVSINGDTFDTYELEVTKSGNGTVTSTDGRIKCGDNCVVDFSDGTEITLTATPLSGYTFAGWSGACTNKTGECVVTMNDNRSVSALFQTNKKLTVAIVGTGTVTSNPVGINCGADCNESYASGTSIKLTAVGTNGAVFKGWSGGCAGSASTCTVKMDAAKKVTATFQSSTSALTVITVGAGSVTSNPAGINCGSDCNENYSAGKSITLTAKANSGMTFLGWGGACSGNNTTCTVNMNTAQTVAAIFQTPNYLLTVITAGPGTVTSSPAGIDCGTDCTEIYTGGKTVTLTAKVNSGKTFLGWGGVCGGNNKTCTVTMNNAQAAAAVFK